MGDVSMIARRLSDNLYSWRNRTPLYCKAGKYSSFRTSRFFEIELLKSFKSFDKKLLKSWI